MGGAGLCKNLQIPMLPPKSQMRVVTFHCQSTLVVMWMGVGLFVVIKNQWREMRCKLWRKIRPHFAIQNTFDYSCYWTLPSAGKQHVGIWLELEPNRLNLFFVDVVGQPHEDVLNTLPVVYLPQYQTNTIIFAYSLLVFVYSPTSIRIITSKFLLRMKITRRICHFMIWICFALEYKLLVFVLLTKKNS